MQVVNWSTWLSALMSMKHRIPVESSNGEGNYRKAKGDEDLMQFSLLKGTGNLLMLSQGL
jgi:hypothetical protein